MMRKRNGRSPEESENKSEGGGPYSSLGLVLGHGASWSRILVKGHGGVRLGTGHTLHSKRGGSMADKQRWFNFRTPLSGVIRNY